MSDKTRLCVVCGRFIARNVIQTDDGPTHDCGELFEQLIYQGSELRRMDEKNARLREELRFAESADDERDAELAKLREALGALLFVTEPLFDETPNEWTEARHALEETTRSEYAPGSGYNDDPVTGQ